MPQNAIFVIVLNWRNAAATVRCVNSLYDMSEAWLLNVIVVDNASGDGSAERIASACPDAHIIEAPSNLGYAGGNNLGIHEALRLGADWIWVLNNDTMVDQECLMHLLDEAANTNKMAIVVPTITLWSDPSIVWYAGGDLDYRRGITRHRFWGEPVPELLTAKEVSFATGCSILVPADIFREIGGLDDRYFLYWEDVEFSHRVRANGYGIRHSPSAVVRHEAGLSADGPDGPSTLSTFLKARNRLWFLRENLPRRERVAPYLWTLPLVARDLARITLRRRHRRVRLSAALLRGTLSGLVLPPKRGAAPQSRLAADST